MPHYSQQQANLLSHFIKNNKNENMQTKLEDCETVLVFANDNAKDSYVMLSRLDEIHVQGSRSKVYDIQQDLNKAIWREHNNNISEVNKWFKAKNKEITNDTQNITMQIQQLFQTYLSSSCRAFLRQMEDDKNTLGQGRGL